MSNREGYGKEWYKARKKSGICIACDSPIVHGRTMCRVQLREHQGRQAKRRRELREKGICEICQLPTNTDNYCCEPCRIIRLEKQKLRTDTRKLNNQCIDCKKQKSEEEIYHSCDACRLKKKIKRQEIRRIIFGHYGQKCNCSCGCNVTNPNHLTVDHIENNGAEHRKQVGKSEFFYRWIIRNNFPDDLQILCFNCNCAKSNYGGCLEEDIKVKPPKTDNE